MAQNLNQALLRLELEVVGANAIKEAASAVEEYGKKTQALQPARVETIIGAIDLATPVHRKVAASASEMARAIQQNAAAIKISIDQARNSISQFETSLRNLRGNKGESLVSSKLATIGVREIRPQVMGEVAGAIGLLPSDMEAISRSDRLYRQGIRAVGQLNRVDPDIRRRTDQLAAEAQQEALQATRSFARLAPQVLPNIIQNPNYRLILQNARKGIQDPGALQGAFANLAPMLAEQRLLDLYRAALRMEAGRSLGRPENQLQRSRLFDKSGPASFLGKPYFFETQKQGFKQLEELDPELVGRLQASIPLGILEQPRNADLEKMALLLASQKKLVSPIYGGPQKKLSEADIAQLFARRAYGLTIADAPNQKLFQTESGKSLDYMPVARTYAEGAMKFRPRTDVKAITAGPMQLPKIQSAPTAIETTVREIGPITPGMQDIANAAEAAVVQGKGMVPGETIEERFRRIGYQRGLKKLEERRAAQKAKSGVPISSQIDIPEPVTPKLSAEEELEERLRKRRRSRKSILPDLGGESGFARIGSISKQAIDMLEEYGKTSIFPKTFSEKLKIDLSVGQRLIKSLQEQGYLGLPAGPGLQGALPIIGAQARRTQQAKQELADAELVDATQKDAQAKRASARATEKTTARIAAAGGAGGGGSPPDEEEAIPGAGGGGGKKGKGKGPPPGPLSRFGGRFLGLGYYLGAAAVLYPILGALSQADQSAKELQTTIQKIQGIYGSHTLGEQLEIKSAIVTAAQKYGENLNEVANAAERFAQAQESIKNIGTDLQTAAAGSRAFGTNMQQIAEFMIGIQEATGGKTTGAQGVNLVAALSRSGVVSPMSLMTAMQQLTPITNEQFAPPSGAITDPALIGSILKTVSQRSGLSGTAVSNNLRYMFARFGRSDTAGNIEKLSGVNLGTLASQGQELKPIAEILRDLAAAYKNFIETGQTAKGTRLLTYLFGPRQIGPGAIFLEEMPKILRDAMEALRDTGALAERAGVQMNTLETAQKKLHNSLTELWGNSMTPIRTGFDNFIAQIVDLISKFVIAGNAAAEAQAKFMMLSPEEQAKSLKKSGGVWGPVPVAENVPPGLYIRTSRPLPNSLPKSIIPTIASGGFEEFVSRTLVGSQANKPEIGTGGDLGLRHTPSAPIYEELPLRNVFAEIMLKGRISLAAQMQRAQAAAIAQQTQTSLQVARLLRQAQGRSTIGLELQGIEAGKVEQGAISQADFTEKSTLYLADIARINKEIKDLQNNPRLDPITQIDPTVRTLQLEERGISAKLALLKEEHSQETLILDIKTAQAKQNAIQLDQTRQQVEKLKDLSNIGRIAQDFVMSGLQGVAQALGGGGPGRGGRAAGAFLGAAATGLGGIMSQGLDLFGPQGAFPGVGKALYGKLGRPSEADITAQAAQLAPAIQARYPGMSLITATELAKDAILKKVNKQQALAAIGQIGGSLLGSTVGGNAKGAEIGATLGTAAGTLIPVVGPIIGGLVGGLIGGLIGGHHKPPPEVGNLKIIADNSNEQVRLLENTNKLLAANFVSFNVPTGFKLPSYQPGSFGGIAVSRGTGGNIVHSAINVNVNVGGTNVTADKLGSTIAQAISDRLELESRSSGAYFPRMLYD